MTELETVARPADCAPATRIRQDWFRQDGARQQVTPVMQHFLMVKSDDGLISHKAKHHWPTHVQTQHTFSIAGLPAPGEVVQGLDLNGSDLRVGRRALSNTSSATSARSSCRGWHATTGKEMSAEPNRVDSFGTCSQHQMKNFAFEKLKSNVFGLTSNV